MVQGLLRTLENQSLIHYKADKQQVVQKACALVGGNFEEERRLEQEAHEMMDQLEKTQSFERHKMFPMLKKKLAEKKGFIL